MLSEHLQEPEGYDGLPPDGCEPDPVAETAVQSHEIHVQCLTQDFFDIAYDGADATSAGFTIAAIQRAAFDKSGFRLSLAERDRLLYAMMQAREVILACVLARRSDDAFPLAASAFDSACAFVVLWAEDDPGETRLREFRRDIAERAQWLRNELHNAGIEKAIAERQAERARQTAHEIKAQALRACHG